MPGYGGLLAIGGIRPNRMTPSLTQMSATVPAQVFEQILPFYEAISPAGVSTISVLTLKCR